MNDAEVKLKVDVGDGAGILRIGNNIKQCQRQADFLKIKIDDLRVGIQQMESMPAEFGKTQITQAKAELERLENQYNKLGPVSEKTNTSIGEGWKKNIKTIGRFTWNMFALGSVFALVARAGRSAMETDESYRASTELTTNALSQLLAPAMKVIINLTQYAVIGIAELVRLFTGYNALAKVTTKNITKAAKATKELNKQLYGFDEITKTDGDKTFNLGLEADLKALDDFQKKVENVQELFNRLNVQGAVDKLKDLWGWIVDNKESLIILGTTFGTVFAVAKVSTWLKGISLLIGSAGAGTGLAGVAGLVKYLLGIGIIAFGVELIYDKLTGRVLIDDLKSINSAVQDQGGWLHDLPGAWKNSYDLIKITLSNWLTDLLNIESANKRIAQSAKSSTQGYGGGWSGSGGFSGGGGSGGGGFAKGLDVVPFDGYYKLHANETVVPAKFTPEMHGLGTNNNEETNRLLGVLIGVMEQQRIINFNMNSRTVEREMQKANTNFSYNG
jgi:uncharacterized membrane protein YgcG